MKSVLCVLMCMGLGSMASAELYTLTDNQGGNSYGATQGVVVDVDTTFNAYYDVPLAAGQTYKLDSVSLWDNSDSIDPYYLAVFDYSFAGFDGDTSAEYLGHSSNSVDLSVTANDTLVTWYFSGITVTADSDGTVNGAGSTGSLYIFLDDDTNRNNWSNPNTGFYRMDGDVDVTTVGSVIYASFGYQDMRAPEIKVSLTPVPEPATMVLLGLGGLLFGRKRLATARLLSVHGCNMYSLEK